MRTKLLASLAAWITGAGLALAQPGTAPPPAPPAPLTSITTGACGADRSVVASMIRATLLTGVSGSRRSR